MSTDVFVGLAPFQFTRAANTWASSTLIGTFLESCTVTVFPVTSILGTICSAHLVHNMVKNDDAGCAAKLKKQLVSA